MADAQTPNTGLAIEDLAKTVVAMGTTITRLGVTVATMPLAILPLPARDNVATAANDLVNTVGNLHLSLAKTALQGLSVATRELNKAIEPAIDSANKALNEVVIPAKK